MQPIDIQGAGWLTAASAKRNAMRSKLLRETKDMIVFHFRCEACDADGELELWKKDGVKPFGCPEKCGARYAPFQYLDKWELKCVVLPVRN